MPYRIVAIALHWLLAVLILCQILGGWYSDSLPDDSPQQDGFESIHIAVGVAILLLTLARIAVRLTNPPPVLPRTLAAWERVLSRISHLGFYLLMLALPLTGWLMKSIPPMPLTFLGLFDLPKVSFMGGMPREQGQALFDEMATVHGEVLVTAMLVLLTLHVAGALKHQFDGSPVLWRMLPFLGKPKND